MRTLFIFLYSTMLISVGFTQNLWKQIGNLDNQILIMEYDSITDKLFISGQFSKIYDNAQELQGACFFDENGTTLIKGTTSNVINNWGVASNIARYHDTLFLSYGGPGATFENDTCDNTMCFLEDTTWKSSLFRQNADNENTFMNIINDTMYFGSWWDVNNASGYIDTCAFHTWDGHHQKSFKLKFGPSSSGRITSHVYYKNWHYFGGHFNLGSPTTKQIIRWNGDTIFESVGGGIIGTQAKINQMVIFQDTIYLGGYFQHQDGNISSTVIKWDGNQYHPIIGFNDGGGIKSMFIYKNILYIAGSFVYNGDCYAENIVAYDGVTFFNLGINSSGFYGINAAAVLHDTLYVGGYFTVLNGDSIKHFAKYTGTLPTGLPGGGHYFKQAIKVFPNPSSNIVNIQCSGNIQQVRAFNISGQQFILSVNNKQADVSNLSPGLYILEVQTREGTVLHAKIVKE